MELTRRDFIKANAAAAAATVAGIIDELQLFRRSERENRLIDHDQEGSMELKKREGYF